MRFVGVDPFGPFHPVTLAQGSQEVRPEIAPPPTTKSPLSARQKMCPQICCAVSKMKPLKKTRPLNILCSQLLCSHCGFFPATAQFFPGRSKEGSSSEAKSHTNRCRENATHQWSLRCQQWGSNPTTKIVVAPQQSHEQEQLSYQHRGLSHCP